MSFEPACPSSSFSAGIMHIRHVKQSKTCVDHAKKKREFTRARRARVITLLQPTPPDPGPEKNCEDHVHVAMQEVCGSNKKCTADQDIWPHRAAGVATASAWLVVGCCHPKTNLDWGSDFFEMGIKIVVKS